MRLATLTDDWPAQLAEALGWVVIAFSQLELVLYVTPKRLRAERFKLYQEWPDNFGVEDRCKQLEAEADVVLDAGSLMELAGLVSRIRSANKRRNDVVHGPWIETHEGQRMIVRDRAGIVISPDARQPLLLEIRELRDRLNSFPWPPITVEQKAKLKLGEDIRLGYRCHNQAF